MREADTKQQLARLQRELETARDIQQSLLPHDPPTLAGFAIAGWNKPADDTGGDYYDDVVAFSNGTAQQDDLTDVVIKRV